MRCAVFLSIFASLLAPALADAPATACRAAFDAAMSRIAQDEAAVRAMLDADAAVLEAPVYHLSEAEAALRAEFSAARDRAAADYRACVAMESAR